MKTTCILLLLSIFQLSAALLSNLRRGLQDEGCFEVKVAIAWDAEFCAAFGKGKKEDATKMAKEIFMKAKEKSYDTFQEGDSCIDLVLVAVIPDKSCKKNEGIYKNMNRFATCRGDDDSVVKGPNDSKGQYHREGYLEDFIAYMIEERPRLQSDTIEFQPGFTALDENVFVHMYSGKNAGLGDVGCAKISDVNLPCDYDTRYGVNFMGYKRNDWESNAPNLFAHELGHNLGAVHTDEASLMSSGISGSTFLPESIQLMSAYLREASTCTAN